MGADESNQAMIPPRADGDAARVVAPGVQYVAELAHDGTILAMNGPSRSYSLDQIVGTKIQRWVAPVAQVELERALAEAFETGEPRSLSWIGAETGRAFESRITPMWSGGAIVRAVVTTRDITEREREREQQALRESEQRFHALVQGAFEGLAITVDGTIVVANEALGAS